MEQLHDSQAQCTRLGQEKEEVANHLAGAKAELAQCYQSIAVSTAAVKEQEEQLRNAAASNGHSCKVEQVGDDNFYWSCPVLCCK